MSPTTLLAFVRPSDPEPHYGAIAAERSRAERLLHGLRTGIVLLLAGAAFCYAPSLPVALRLANAAVLVPMLAWCGLHFAVVWRNGGSVPRWLSIVSPVVDATAVSAILLLYGLLGSAEVALKAPIALAYFVILASRPMTGSSRTAGAAALVTTVEYAVVMAVLIPRTGPLADPVTAAASARVSLLDEVTRLVLLASCGAIATYATAWHQRVLTSAVAAQFEHDNAEREVAAKLQEADKLAALGIVAASLAHEVNNPLATIALSAEMLAQDAHDAGTRDELNAIAGDARRTALAVRELLNFARAGSAERGAVSLDEIVARAVATVRSFLRNAHVQVETELAADGATIWGDAPALERVVINLVINAAQAMESVPGERRVRICTRRSADAVQLTVEDTGPGFAPGAAERLFERFFTTKPPGKGTGLGLWMVAQVIEHHHGRISALDTGSGARFTVTLPRPKSAAAAA